MGEEVARRPEYFSLSPEEQPLPTGYTTPVEEQQPAIGYTTPVEEQQIGDILAAIEEEAIIERQEQESQQRAAAALAVREDLGTISPTDPLAAALAESHQIRLLPQLQREAADPPQRVLSSGRTTTSK